MQNRLLAGFHTGETGIRCCFVDREDAKVFGICDRDVDAGGGQQEYRVRRRRTG